MTSARQSAPLWLRPLHGWFFWWETAIPSLYRVAAVVVGAGITTLLSRLFDVRPLISGPLALVAWIGLGVIQEHDERVILDVDAEFARGLRQQIDPVLARRGYEFNTSYGPCRARSERTDVFLYEAHGPDDQSNINLWILRDQSNGHMDVDMHGGQNLSQYVASAGDVRLADRVTRALDPVGDVTALVSAFSVVPDTFWS